MLIFSEGYNASAVAGRNGGRIFIDVGDITRCRNLDEVAGILARHNIERTTAQFFAKHIARFWDTEGYVGKIHQTSQSLFQ
jgi:hypothetical protein